MNKYVKWGLLLNAFSITINQFIEVPDFIMYFIIGIGFSLYVFGMISSNHDMTKFINWKRNLFKSFIKQ